MNTPTFGAADWPAHHALSRPSEIAVASADTGEARTWAELEDLVARTATALLEAGLSAGDRVAVVCDNHPRFFELQFAAMRAGIVMVPLNWRLAVEEMRYQCSDAEVSGIVFDKTWAASAADVADGAGIDLRLPMEELAGRGVGRTEPGEPDPDTVTHILYTSGTTGMPKGALVSHRSLQWNAFNIVRATQVAAPGVHMLNPMPLFHAGGLNVLANPILMYGGRVTTMARWDPPAILRYIGNPENAVTHITTAPPLLQMLVDSQDFTTIDFSTLRKIVIGGGACTPELLKTFAAKGIELHPQYGGTETGPAALVLEDGIEKAFTGTSGKPVIHTRVRLVDPETLTDVGVDEVGEIWLKGPSITPGYWRLPDAEHFVDGWFRTGDAARRDAEGYYFISGRFKDMYKSGGENVYAAEVENVLVDLPNVAEIAIVGMPDPKWGEVGLAVVVPTPGATVTLGDLHAACEGKLARYKFPHRIEITDALIRNVTGKVSKPDLRARYLDQPS